MIKNYKKTIANIIKENSIYVVNRLFQNLFLVDYDCKFNKNFTSRVLSPENIKIENNSKSVLKSFAVSGGCYYHAYAGIEIGNGTIWSANVSMITLDHDFDNYDAIIIGRNCWIGAGSVILSGVVLGDKTIVGANSVVNKSFDEGNVVIAGVPAKIIRKL